MNHTKIKEHYLLIFVVIVVLAISLVNFIRASEFLYPDWDGFWYLSYSKNLLLGKGDFLYEVRSPIAAIILPDLFLARIEMIAFHLGITVLVYLIVFRLTKNKLASSFSALVYGLNSWMITFLVATLSDLPAMFFFLLSLYLWLDGKDRKKLSLAGISAGIAFLLRFDMILLILPLLLLSLHQKRSIKCFLLSFLGIAFLLELFLSVLVYENLHHSSYAFFHANVFAGEASALAEVRESNIILKFFELFFLPLILALSALFYHKEKRNTMIAAVFLPAIIMLMIVPVPDNRILFVKALPFLALLSHNFIYLLKEKVEKPLFPILIIFLIAILSNLIIFSQFSYPEWHLERTPCYEGMICTNIPGAVNYFCEKEAVDINLYSKGYVGLIQGADPLESVKENAARCDYIIYYKDAFGYNHSIRDYLSGNYDIVFDNGVAVVYKTDSF